MALRLCINHTPRIDQRHVNSVYVAPGVLDPSIRYVRIAGQTFAVGPHRNVRPTDIVMNLIQRRSVHAATGDIVTVEPVTASLEAVDALDTLTVELDVIKRIRNADTVTTCVPVCVDAAAFLKLFRRRYAAHTFAEGQHCTLDFEGVDYLLCVRDLTVTRKKELVSPPQRRGMMVANTAALLRVGSASRHVIELIKE